ncbi:MAG: hypothetical protein LQ345_004491 [Seirophora villosa]|nr:MAG: hypothetical protein LQ345_004491 [Seirophora villosa]
MEDITLLHDFEKVVHTLSKLDFVAIGGGALKDSVGKKLHAHGVTLLNHFGATELGPLAPIFYPTESYDYRYIKIRKDMRLTLEFADPDPHSRVSESPMTCKLIGYPFAWGTDFELQDELECNPKNPTSEVRILGRMDDLIVLATGEKVMPQLLERALEEHPSVRRAIAFGHGRDEIGVLVEPNRVTPVQEIDLVEALWPIVLEVNVMLDGHARLSSKASILIKPTDKEIPISDKGSVQRKEVYDKFDSEIRAVYKRQQKTVSPGLAMPFDDTAPQKSIRDMVQSCLPDYLSSHSWADDLDLIQLGMDSLQITRLFRILCASLDHSDRSKYCSGDIGKDFIYAHPSVSQLALALTSHSPEAEANVVSTMEKLASRYAIEDAERIPDTAESVVLLTGATGSLGAHLVKVLCGANMVKSVIALVRTNPNLHGRSEKSAKERLQGALEERDIALSDTAWSKIDLMTWIPGSHLLGLTRAEYVLGRHPLAKSSQRIPESAIKNESIPLPMGYAQAKWVCESIIESAQRNLQGEIDCRICRVGQLSGATSTGIWSSNEHIPALLKASQAIGFLPDLRGTLSWLPVDQAAGIVVELLISCTTPQLVLHVENPIRQSWSDVCTIFERKLQISHSWRKPFHEWLEVYRAEAANSTSLL